MSSTSSVSTLASATATIISFTATATPSTTSGPSSGTDASHDSKGSLWKIFIILGVLIIVLVICVVAWLTHRRNQPLNKHTFTSAFSDMGTWINRTWYKIVNPRSRSAGAGFEGVLGRGRSGSNRAGRSGFEHDDDLWDSHVEDTSYGGGGATEYGYGGNKAASASRSGVGGLELRLNDRRYEEFGRPSAELIRGAEPSAHSAGTVAPPTAAYPPAKNPFSDNNAAPSVRSISPKPENVQGEQPSPSRPSLFKEAL